MKKFLIFLLVCVFVFSFASCSQATEMSNRDILNAAEDILEDRGKIIVDEDDYEDMQSELDDLREAAQASSVATSEAVSAPTEKPEPTSASTSTFIATPSETDPDLLLKEDEYNAYENGEISILISAIEVTDIFFSIEQKPDQLLETKRGVHIGSTVDEVAAAYAGIPAVIFEFDVIDEIPLDKFIESYPDIYDEDDYSIEYETGFVGDAVFTGFEFYLMLEDNGIDFADYLNDPAKFNEEYDLAYFRMHISFRNNVVDSIVIME